MVAHKKNNPGANREWGTSSANLSQPVAVMTEHEKVENALRTLTVIEKELRCVYRISRVLLDESLHIEDALQKVVDLLAEAMQHSASAVARIAVGNVIVETRPMPDGGPTLEQALQLDDGTTGQITVTYDRDDAKEGRAAFLVEEREMLRNIADVLSIHLLRHKDKLALGEALDQVRNFERIIDTSPAIAFLWDLSADWPVAFVSDNIRQFGYEPKDFYSGAIRFADIVHPDDLSRVGEEVEQYMASGAADFQQRYRILTRSGDVRWVVDWTQVLRDQAGQATQNQGIILDVTETVGAENLARQYLKTAGNIFVALDAHGRVLAVNDKTCELVGETEEDLIGCDWIETYVPEEEKERARAYLQTVIKDGLSGTGEYENPIVLPDGEQRTIHWYHSTEYDAKGQISGIIAFGADVTEAQEVAEKARQLSRFPLENPSPVLRLDRNGDVLLANQAAQNLINDLAEGGAHGREAWSGIVSAAISVNPPESQQIQVADRIFLFQIASIPDREYVNLYGLDMTAERESKRGFQDIVANAPGAIFQYIIHPDGTHSVYYMSDGCRDIWGLSPRQICNDPNTMWAMIHPDDLPLMEASVADSAENLSQWRLEWRIISQSGKEKWLRGTGTPHKRSNGDISATALVIDITDEKTSADAVAAALRKTINVLSAALEARDPYTACHEERVAVIAVAIGREMGLNAHRLIGLELAATVHDVGKIRIPAEILSKPTRLSKAEFELVKEHPETGAELLKSVKFEWPVADIIRQHHERYDGSGYPYGLSGNDILLEARVLAVADTFEAMASHRPYRAGLGIEAAAAEIRDGAGTRYDPDVAKACLSLLDKGATELTSLKA